MKQRKYIKKHQIVLTVFFVLFGTFVYWLNTQYLTPYTLYSGNLHYEKAEVVSIVDRYLEEDEDTTSGYRGQQKLEVKILTGEFKGKVLEAENNLTRTHNIYAKKGSTLIVCIDVVNDGFHVSVFNYSRSSTIYLMLALFVLLMVIVGGMKGLKSAIGLAFSFMSVLFFALPLIFHGYSPILISIVTVIMISAVTLILIDGITKKVAIALSSTAIGAIAAGVMFMLFGAALKVSGFNLEEAESIYMVSVNTGLQLKNILFAGVLIAAVGAVLDVAMSIASTINELYELNPTLTSKEIFQAGINVGKDMIGTMANTLIMAYAGSSFATMILFMAYGVSYYQIINMDYLVLEVAQAISGSIGIVLTVPFAAFIGSKVLTSKRWQKQQEQE